MVGEVKYYKIEKFGSASQDSKEFYLLKKSFIRKKTLLKV
jgi:hypothetical protein